MTQAMKPCPFCGGEAKFETYGGTACAVVCQACHCGTPTVRLDDGMAAVELWNRRERVVRCRDCAMYDDDDGMCMRDPEHTGRGWYARPDGFCADGRRKE